MLNARIAVASAALLALMLSTATFQAAAQTLKLEPARPTQSIEGVDSFKAYCATCHGTAGKGNGPAASALKTAPPDLTTLKQRKGRFSPSDIENRIVGRNIPAVHGSGDMPVWGPIFGAFTADTGVEKLRVNNLVNYIGSIQAP
jgi:mono/diheme cytochrome c family protein